MPDLATHTILAVFFQRASRGYLKLPLVLLGTIIPDLLARVPIVISWKLFWLGVPYHSPIPLLFLAYLCTLLFQEKTRKKVFISILSGMYFHLILDGFQWHLSGGIYYWLYPFSRLKFEWGFITSQTIFTFLPYLVIIFVVCELARSYFAHRKDR